MESSIVLVLLCVMSVTTISEAMSTAKPKTDVSDQYKFIYDHNSDLFALTMQGSCYLMALFPSEVAVVHEPFAIHLLEDEIIKGAKFGTTRPVTDKQLRNISYQLHYFCKGYPTSEITRAAGPLAGIGK